jgi:hypothetical protein
MDLFWKMLIYLCRSDPLVRLNGALRQGSLDGAVPTLPKFGIALKGEVLTSTAFDK